ncbi:MAG: T9SS type A sorting domain-containing protein [Bacteroidota bacterium]
MKSILSVLCLCLICLTASAQVRQPSVVLDTLHPSTYRNFLVLEQGPVFRGIGPNAMTGSGSDLSIVMLDSNFVETNQTISSLSPYFLARNAIALPGGDLIIAGITAGALPLVNSNMVGSVVRADAGGQIKWQAKARWDSVFHGSYGVALDSTGQILLSGSVNGRPIFPSATLSKFAPTGDAEWEQIYSDFDPDTSRTSFWSGIDVAVRSDNQYLLLAYTNSTWFPHGMALLRIDEMGNLVDTTFFAQPLKFALGMSLDKQDNAFVFASERQSPMGAAGIIKVWKLNPQGDTLWSKVMDYQNPQETGWSSIFIRGRATADGGCALLFSVRPPNPPGSLNRDQHVYLTKLGPNGNTQWEITLLDSGYQYPSDLIQLKDGGYVVGGYYYPDSTSTSQLSYFVKLSDDGSMVSNERFQGQSLQVSIGPNPFTDQSIVRFQLAKSEEVDITVTDLNGRIVYENRHLGTSGLNQIQVPLSHLARATYTLELTSATASWRGKIVKQ